MCGYHITEDGPTETAAAGARNNIGHALFEKTCETTQKDVTSHVFFWILKKTRKNICTVSHAT